MASYVEYYLYQRNCCTSQVTVQERVRGFEAGVGWGDEWRASIDINAPTIVGR